MRFTHRRPARRTIFTICFLVVVTAPIIGAMRAVRLQHQMLGREVLVRPPASTAGGAVRSEDAERSATIARYLATRDSLVDRLLPEGASGSHYYTELEGYAGEAFAETASIGLTVQYLSEATEIHERAHLLDAALAAPVARLMKRIAAPMPKEYAAKNDAEHFAEMARQAWDLVHPAKDFCPTDAAVAQLDSAEHRVPGTAGFVSRFLHTGLFHGLPEERDLLSAADSISAPLHAEWQDIWAGLDNQRRTDGSYRAWPVPTLLSSLQTERGAIWAKGGALNYYQALLLWPAIAVVKLTRAGE